MTAIIATPPRSSSTEATLTQPGTSTDESIITDDQKKTILIVEDEEDISELIHYNLTKEGYQAHIAPDGHTGLDSALSNPPDLILLDIMLPYLDGFAVCQKLREDTRTRQIPIIMLTAKGEETDTVHGLDLGADDYIIKPFSTSILIARVRSHLRRYELYTTALSEGPSPGSDLTHLGPLTLDERSHMIFLHSKPLILTLSEFKLLATLMSNREQVFSREQLIHAIAGEGVHLMERNVDVHVLSLRKKLGEDASLIQTIRGVGYKCSE